MGTWRRRPTGSGIGLLALVLSLLSQPSAWGQIADADGDGVADGSDNCLNQANSDQANRDRDRLGDLCDPFPDHALKIRVEFATYALAGDATELTFRLEDQTGELAEALEGVRITLALEGSARFGSEARVGSIVSGANTGRILGEFSDGLLIVAIDDPQLERIRVTSEDTEQQGVERFDRRFFDFEPNDGGFTHSGVNDSWSWGAPDSGPRAAFSGSRVWATNLTGRTPHDVDASLDLPELTIPPLASAVLQFQHWVHLETAIDVVELQLSEDRGANWIVLQSISGDARAWAPLVQSLASYAGRTVQLRFRFRSNAVVQRQGWYLDDLMIEGLEPVIEFVDPNTDTDGDGLDNREEFERGTDFRRVDTDLDGVTDDRDNCPLVSNQDQLDTVIVNGIGDDCDDTDSDGAVDRFDNCPRLANADQLDVDFDSFGDRCDNCPQVPNPDQADTITPGDGIGDVCVDSDGDGHFDLVDNCPQLANADQSDPDFDGIGNACDNCPDVWNRDQVDLIRPNGVGDACDDPDQDGVPDLTDNCRDVSNRDQLEQDGDALGDACDNCPLAFNPGQGDRVHRGNGLGDACDDPDGDGVADAADLCPDTPDVTQSNVDGDALGDSCDPYPLRRLVVRADVPRATPIGQPLVVRYRLEDAFGGSVTDIPIVRARLLVSGAARFGDHASVGRLISGGGSNTIEAELWDGAFEITLTSDQRERVRLELDDLESIGLELWNELTDSFESYPSSLASVSIEEERLADPWFQAPARLSGAFAHSGKQVWNGVVARPGDYNGSLATGPLELDSNRAPFVEFWDFLRVPPGGNIYGTIWVHYLESNQRVQLGVRADGQFEWQLQRFQLEPPLGTRHIRLLFDLRNTGNYSDQGWLLDDLRIGGLGQFVHFFDPVADSDRDGLNDADEAARGTLLSLADSDGDLVGDQLDNCPLRANPRQRDELQPGAAGDACEDRDQDSIADLSDNCLLAFNRDQRDVDGDDVGDLCDNCVFVWNALQSDSYHLNGIGDACDDPDRDGIADDLDLCPDASARIDRDTDQDGLGDACDPYPYSGFVIRIAPRAPILVGAEGAIELSLEDEFGQPLRTPGIRFSLEVDAPARFTTVSRGVLHSQASSTRVELEFVDGSIVIGLISHQERQVGFRVFDSSRLGVRLAGDLFENFERDDGGFSSEVGIPGGVNPWEWGQPAPGTVSPFSGLRLWGTTLSGNYPERSSGYLITPLFEIPAGVDPELRFQHWSRSPELTAFKPKLSVEIERDLSGTWEQLETLETEYPGWRAWTGNLLSQGARLMRVRFHFTNAYPYWSYGGSPTSLGWYLDDLEVRGLAMRVTFLDGGGDPDNDQVTSADEIARGLDPLAADTDRDGLPDAVDNCPLLSNHDQRDRWGRPGVGDACEDTDHDGLIDQNDLCPLVPDPDRADRDSDGLGDACDRYPADRFVARVRMPNVVRVGQPVSVLVELEDQFGAVRHDVSGVVIQLNAGAGLFAEAASAGIVRRGGGTGLVELELIAGRAQIDWTATYQIESTLVGVAAGEDPVEVLQELAHEDFEASAHTAFAARPWGWERAAPPFSIGAEGHHLYASRGPFGFSLGVPPVRVSNSATLTVRYRSWIDRDVEGNVHIVDYQTGAKRIVDVAHTTTGQWEWRTFRVANPPAQTQLLFAAQSFQPELQQLWGIDEYTISSDIRLVAARHADPNDDSDQDGWNDLIEFEQGTDPQLTDTDQDLIPDPDDRCPRNYDPGNPDRTPEDGRPDACSNLDGDPHPDRYDTCPRVANEQNVDSDQDGVGDSCDLEPNSVLVLQPTLPRVAVAGSLLQASFVLHDQSLNQRPDLLPLRVVLVLEQGGVFTGQIDGGEIVEGVGTDRVLIELNAADLTLQIDPQGASTISLRGEDPMQVGLVVPHDFLADFERDDGGLRPYPGAALLGSGYVREDHWFVTERGISSIGEHSGHRFVRTRGDSSTLLGGGLLRTPGIWLPPGATPVFSLNSAQTDYTRHAVSIVPTRESLPARGLVTLGNQGDWQRHTSSLEVWSGQYVRFAFEHEPAELTFQQGVGWTVDDVAVTGLTAMTRVISQDGDEDGDQLSNTAELAAGLDPLSTDSDSDAVDDFHDNCPLAANSDQADLVTPGSGGDACDDGDQDGVVDRDDTCPAIVDPSNLDSDLDRMGDRCDPYPQHRFRIETARTVWAVAGDPVEIELQLLDQRGELQVSFREISVLMNLSGSAAFDSGAQQQRVTFVDGRARVSVLGPQIEVVRLTSEDDRQLGVEPIDVVWNSFEESDEGYSPNRDSWLAAGESLWGRTEILHGPAGAHTGSKAWTATPNGIPTGRLSKALTSPWIVPPYGSSPQLSFWSWYRPEGSADPASLTLLTGNRFRTLETFPERTQGWQEVRHTFQINSSIERGRFQLAWGLRSTRYLVAGTWVIDDVRISDMAPSIVVLEPTADPDNDGLDHRSEVAAGTDLFAADTDLDGVRDDVDNCPLRWNREQRDTYGGDLKGDACSDQDGDGLSDELDLCDLQPVEAVGDRDKDGVGDLCDPYPDLALFARPILPIGAVTGAPQVIEFVLEDQLGLEHPEISGIELLITASGSAALDGHPAETRLSFVAGRARLIVQNDVAELVQFDARDEAQHGVSYGADYRESFETDDHGFTSRSNVGNWQLGTPISGPGAAASGVRAWGLPLEGQIDPNSEAVLIGPVVRMSESRRNILRFRVWNVQNTYVYPSLTVTAGVTGPGDPRASRVGSSVNRSVNPAWYDLPASFYYGETPPRLIQPTLAVIPGIVERTFGDGVFFDDLHISDVYRELRFFDPAGDHDDDGIENLTELSRGSDPSEADPDGDRVRDDRDNCPVVWNPEQRDQIAPGGLGDQCADPDGDGIVDAEDRCPLIHDRSNSDRDQDWLGDACDPMPDRLLRVAAQLPAFALADSPQPVEYLLIDADRKIQSDLTGVRVTLTLQGGARFAAQATVGTVLAGGGTDHALVEFEQGRVVIDLLAAAPGVVQLGAEDTEQIGVEFDAVKRFEFEHEGDAFIHDGVRNPWRWIVPMTGPGSAASGRLAYGTGNRTPDDRRNGGALLSPPILLSSTARPYLSVDNWLRLRTANRELAIEVRERGSDQWVMLRHPNTRPRGWERLRYDLSDFAGRELEVRFIITSAQFDPRDLEWFVDNVEFGGAGVLIEFHAGAEDLDGDGLDNRSEAQLGTNPRLADTDRDSIGDGADNCPLTENRDQADLVHPNGRGDACDDPDRDGVFDAIDLCPDDAGTAERDSDGDRRGDGCDNCPGIFNPLQWDTDRDGVGNSCSNDPGVAIEFSPEWRLSFAPADVVFDAKRRVLYAVDRRGRRIVELSLASGRADWAWQFELEPLALSLSPSGDRLFVALQQQQPSELRDLYASDDARQSQLASIDLTMRQRDHLVEIDQDPFDLAAIDERIVFVSPASGYEAYSDARAYDSTNGERHSYAVMGTKAYLQPTPDRRYLVTAHRYAFWYFWDFYLVRFYSLEEHGSTDDIFWLGGLSVHNHQGRAWPVSNSRALSRDGALFQLQRRTPNWSELIKRAAPRFSPPLVDVLPDVAAGEYWVVDQQQLSVLGTDQNERRASFPLYSQARALGRVGSTTYLIRDQDQGVVIERIPYNHPPTARAGSAQSLECEGDGKARVQLDGSSSHDPDGAEDLQEFIWLVDGVERARAMTAAIDLEVGVHQVTLTVRDAAGTVSSDSTTVEIIDTTPPLGTITFPAPSACFGPAAIPVTILDELSDSCSEVTRSYAPAPGPSYNDHGDYEITLTARDASGNQAQSAISFTIDTVPPTVRIAPDGSFETSDDDQARGETVLERMYLDGCLLYDGATYGDGDGLLSDEQIRFDQASLCRAASVCARTQWKDPVLRVEAHDCGGNTGAAEQVQRGRHQARCP
jgi:hypothetical protein